MNAAPAELWQRALMARRLGLTPEQMNERAQRHAEQRKNWARAGGYANRTHPAPKIGDAFGCRRIVACLGAGRKGRADASFRLVCDRSGAETVQFEFNMRKNGNYCRACRSLP